MILTLTKFRSRNPRPPTGRNRLPTKSTALIALALIVGITAIVVPSYRTADAATELTPGIDRTTNGGFCPVNPEFINILDDPAPRGVLPAHSEQGEQAEVTTIVVVPGPQMEPVWNADMTVGMAQGSDVTYVGYMPVTTNGDGIAGNLDVVDFNHHGVDYTVLSIFQQQVNNGFQQLVLGTDTALPNELTFQAGDDRFTLAEAVHLGANRNIHAWYLDESLNWEDGQTVPVGLMQPSPQSPPGPICH